VSAAPDPPAVHRRWTTPRVLRALVGAIWFACALVFAVGLRALNADRAALHTIGKDAAPSIVAAEEIGAQLADLDAQLANSLLGSASGRDVAQELFELRRSAATKRLLDAAGNITYGDAERIPVLVMQEELGRYLELVARAQWLYQSGDHDGAVAVHRLATNLMQSRILPAADALDRANRDVMDREYAGAQASTAAFLAQAGAAGALLVAVLAAAQVFLTRRTRRIFSPALVGATILALVFTSYLFSRFRGAREHLRAAHDDAFNSIHTLWKARAVAYAARGDESRWLLDPARAPEYEGRYRERIAQLWSRRDLGYADAVVPHSPVAGLVADELRNVTFPGEQRAAEAIVEALKPYLDADQRLRDSEAKKRHADAIELCIGPAAIDVPVLFDHVDEAIQRTTLINQDWFDATMASADAGLGRAEWLDPAFALAIALLGWLGIRSRLREYS
jgi:hypothetical protein